MPATRRSVEGFAVLRFVLIGTDTQWGELSLLCPSFFIFYFLTLLQIKRDVPIVTVADYEIAR